MPVYSRQVIVSATTTTLPWFDITPTKPAMVLSGITQASARFTFQVAKNRLAGGGDCRVELQFSIDAEGTLPFHVATMAFSPVVDQTTKALYARSARFVVQAVSGNSSPYALSFLQPGP